MDRRKGKKVGACRDGDKGKEAKKMLLTDLPTSMVMEILSWLPLKSLFECSEDDFPENESRYLCINQIVKAPDRGLIQIEETIFSPRLNLPDSSFNLVNSCNGLVLLCGTERNLVYVCNPVLGEFITIRVPKGTKRTSKAFCFGFNVKTNQYKVVQTFYVNGEGRKAEVYTLGTRSWTSLGNAPFSIGCMRFNTFLHGACHWVDYSKSNDKKIACFDFEKDLFREVPSPPQYKPERDGSLKLGVIGDSFCASCYRDDDPFQFDIWVMKDYGVKESWTRQFRITKYESLFDSHIDYCYPLMLLKDGRMLLTYNE
ncbi:hypothetical protein COLO4_16487 [Corchorus olitorius]|uniref:F-box associated beta-propeller type 1 domain-containing protein n=1 Tax=Corchorus olitorius TaxID=93759 RepID=A0A1R3JH93_9ROSI|nr:hypothetical protein COLO4_16487 [Corchorus olitorius]